MLPSKLDASSGIPEASQVSVSERIGHLTSGVSFRIQGALAGMSAAGLTALPEPFRSFYARRAARRLLEVCEAEHGSSGQRMECAAAGLALTRQPAGRSASQPASQPAVQAARDCPDWRVSKDNL